MNLYEIYWNKTNDHLLVEESDGSVTELNQMPMSWQLKVDRAIEEQYPTTYEILTDLYGTQKQQTFKRVKQFLACNFSEKDGIPDIDEDFNFRLEKTACPARVKGICELKICAPEINSDFSARELEVIRLFVTGMTEEQIAEHMFLSHHTIHNHIKNMYRKTNLVGKSNPDRLLMAYAFRKKII